MVAFEFAAANTPATGAPTISGTARVGETLTAATAGIVDTDGLMGVSYTYQWIREDSNGMNPVEIGMDSSTYALVAADEGKKIKVQVSFQDEDGNDEELTSAAYPAGMETVGAACEVLWCATLTVGTTTGSGGNTIYGYRATLLETGFGSLSPRTFTRGTVTVGVGNLSYNSGTGGKLTFHVGRSAGTVPSDGLLGSAGLVLTLGSKTIDFTPIAASLHELDPTGLSWNDGDTVEVSLALAATAPNPPTALEAVPYGHDAILLSWTAPASGTTPTGYKVEVSDDDGANWTDAEDDTESTDTSYIHEGLMASATRHYRVSALAAGTPSTPSGTASATTCAAGVPWCPTLTAGTTTALGFTLTGFDTTGFSPYGSLSPASFRHGGSTYSSDQLQHADSAGNDPNVILSFESALPAALDGFALRSGAQELSLASATYHVTDFTYEWLNPPFGPWTDGQEAAFELAAANTNTAPVITTTSPQSVAENATAVATLTATDADTGDTHTWSKNGGADADKFTLTTAGVLTFAAAPDFEAPTDTGGDNGYAVIVRVSDATATADLTLTVNVTDADEQPATPAAPGVIATSGTTDSLTVSWTAPGLNGGPAIAGYDLQYRPGTGGNYLDGPQGVTEITADITGLTEATGYQVQVRALNGETPSDWSDSGTGTTGSPENDAPVFAESTLTREVAENTAADVNVGAEVTATDADDDTLEYTLEGADADAFTIDGASGQIKTKAGVSYDHETKASYEIAVRANDGNGGTGTVAVTVNVTDVDEQPETPAAPAVGATPGSTTSLEVTWTKPGRNGGPDIAGYAVQYRPGTDGNWLDHGHGGTGTSTTIGTLTARTEYQARVRALNGETPSEWSEPGSGATATAAGVTLSTASLALGEGTEATYTVVLKAPPTGPVTVTPRVVDNAEVRVSAALTFTAMNWAEPQDVTVSADHDADDVDDEATVEHKVTGANYNGITAADVEITVTDDEGSFGTIDVSFRAVRGGADKVAGWDGPLPDIHSGEAFQLAVQFRRAGDYVLLTERCQPLTWEQSQSLSSFTVCARGPAPDQWLGPNGALRVTGAQVRLIETAYHRIRMELTPTGPARDVTVTVQPLPCPAAGAMCVGSNGLSKRLKLTVRGVTGPPEAPGNVTVEPIDYHEDGGNDLRVSFDLDPVGVDYLIQWQRAGKAWASPGEREGWRGQKRIGRDSDVIFDVVAGQAYDVRVRWENDRGPGPWTTVYNVGGTGQGSNRGAPEVERIERHGDQVWIFFDRDLDTGVARHNKLTPQFGVHYSESAPAGLPDTLAANSVNLTEIVKTRHAGACTSNGQACRIVRLTLNPVIRGGTEYDGPADEETVSVSYWKSYREPDNLRAAGEWHSVPHVAEFSRVVADPVGTTPTLSVADAEGREGSNPSIRFAVRLAPTATEQVTVRYYTTPGTAQRADYANVNGTLTFAPGEWRKIVEVPIMDDGEEDSGETFFFHLDRPSRGARIGDDRATGTILNREDGSPPPVSATVPGAPLTAAFRNLSVAAHDGKTAFTFELTFSEEVTGLSYETLRDSAFTVTNGRVTGVRRLNPPSNIAWEISVEPGGEDHVVITLPATTDCTATGAICIGDDRPLSAPDPVTVPGPVETPVEEDPVEEDPVEEDPVEGDPVEEDPVEEDPPPPPLTASFPASGIPVAHDGSTAFELQFHLSEEPQELSYTTVRNAVFTVTGGAIEGARRQVQGSNRNWVLTVAPSGDADVTVRVKDTTSCSSGPRLCTADERMLAGGLKVTIDGPPPPELSVADAAVDENDGGALLDFTVTLNRVPNAAVTVNYATSDGSGTNPASASADYAARSGTLSFAVGERSKTVSVAVYEDSHDEGAETMLLTLSNPAGATIADATATGTINNSDPMPKGWLARFGRTASVQTVDAIRERLAGGERRSADNHFTVGGRRVDRLFDEFRNATRGADAKETGDGAAPDRRFEDESAWERMDRLKAESMDRWAAPGGLAAGAVAPGGIGLAARGPAPTGLSSSGASRSGSNDAEPPSAGLSPDNDNWSAGLERLLSAGLGDLLSEGLSGTGVPVGGLVSAARPFADLLSRGRDDWRALLMGSSFDYSRTLDDGAGTANGLSSWTAWGRAAETRFSGADGLLSIDGAVATAIVGADAQWGRWLAGVAVSYSFGEGGYSHATAAGGDVTSRLTSINPYANFTLNERLSLWGAVGYGVGDLSLQSARAGDAIETGLESTMAAFGGRGVFSRRAGGLKLAVVSDALFTNTVSEAATGLMGAEGASSRVRLMLEGSGSMPLPNGAVLRPTLEAGLRYDGGDAETGAGVEIGGGLAFSAGRLSVELNVRGLLAHEDAEYEEWGFSGSLKWQPNEDGRGWAMEAGSSWGDTASGVNALWSRQDASGLVRAAGMDAARRFHAQLGYGFEGRRGRALWVPFFATESSAGQQAYRMGVKLTSGANLEAGLELGRRTGTRGMAEAAFRLQGSMRW